MFWVKPKIQGLKGYQTWADLYKAIVLDKDGVTGQVTMNNGWITWMQVTKDRNYKTSVFVLTKKHPSK